MKRKQRKGITALIVFVCISAALFLFWKKETPALETQATLGDIPQGPVVTPTMSELKEPHQTILGHYIIPELGLKFPLSGFLRSDLVYGIEDFGDSKAVSFTTKSLMKATPACDPLRTPLGALVKAPGNFMEDESYRRPSEEVGWRHNAKELQKVGAVQFDSFFIFYEPQHSSCLNEQTDVTRVTYPVNVLREAIKKVSPL